jgi:hypothetical protein
MKLRTRILAVAMTLVMVVAMLPALAFADASPVETVVTNEDGTTTTTVRYDENNFIELVKNASGQTVSRTFATNRVPLGLAGYDAQGTDGTWSFTYAADGSVEVTGDIDGTLANGILTVEDGSYATRFRYDEKSLVQTPIDRVGTGQDGMTMTEVFTCSDPVESDEAWEYEMTVERTVAANGTTAFEQTISTFGSASKNSPDWSSSAGTTEARIYENGTLAYKMLQDVYEQTHVAYDKNGSVANTSVSAWMGNDLTVSTVVDGITFKAAVTYGSTGPVVTSLTAENEAGEKVVHEYAASDMVRDSSSVTESGVTTSIDTVSAKGEFEILEYLVQAPSVSIGEMPLSASARTL